MGEGTGPTGIERHHLDLAPPKGGAGGGKKDRFTGPDGKEWSTWLVKDIKEAKAITNPLVEKEIARLARLPNSMVTPDLLRNVFFKLEELVDTGKAIEPEIALWGARIDTRAEKLSTPRSVRAPRAVPAAATPPMDATKFGRAVAESLGTPRPEKQLEFYRSFEEKHTPFRVVPGQPLPFFVLYEHDQQEWEKQFRLWEIRSILTMAAAQKTVAGSVDSVANPVPDTAGYNDPFGVETKKERLAFLIENQPGVLPAMSIWTTIIGGKEFVGPNPDHLKDVLLKISDKEIKALGYSSKETNSLIEERDRLRKAIPESVWGSDEPGFHSIRESLRFFLKTKARSLLFSNDREKSAILGSEFAPRILADRARDAEQPAWNFVFVTGLLESFNTREACWYIEKKKGKQLGPSNFMTLYLWMLLHPQQRFEDKIAKPNETGTSSVAKEDWSALGTWGVNHIQKGWWPIDTSGKRPRPIVPKILRPDLIEDALRAGENHNVFYDFFTDIGPKILSKPSVFNHKDLSSSMFNREIKDKKGKLYKPWSTMGDSPFVPYRFDILRWANIAFTVFKKGPNAERDVSMGDLAEASRNLKLSLRERAALLIIRFGHNVNHRDLVYQGGRLVWMSTLLPEIKRAAPDIFKNEDGTIVENDFDGAGERVKVLG